MKIEGQFLTVVCVLIQLHHSYGKTWLNADGNSSNTYTLINSIFGKNAVEVPDCAHPGHDRTPHITQVMDGSLNRPVFTFHVHTTPDNDMCKIFDRQRVEIKTYNASPSHLKGYYGETATFSWNFLLDSKFQASSKFCHIHQIKEHGLPVITISPRKNSEGTQSLEVMYNNTDILQSEDLSKFLGTWVHAKEELTYHRHGKYSLVLSKLDNGVELMRVSKQGINLWRDKFKFIRPKWGLYRSLGESSSLRDEDIYFDSFCLSKGSNMRDKCV